MRYQQQLDESDCGAACLSMIASHFGKGLSLSEIREYAGTDIIGTNLKGMVNAAGKYGLKALPMKGTEESISSELPTPFIVHLHIHKSEENIVDHYVVVKKITKKKIIIWDPDPLEKKIKLSYDTFLEWWTGYLIFFEPTQTFTKTKKENLLLKFLPIFLPHKKVLFFSFLCSVLLLAFGLITSFYYKYIFDEIIFSKATFSLHTLSFGMLLVILIQSIVGSIRSIFLSHFSYKSDLQLNFSYLSHIFHLPLSFFESRKSGEILSRLGDLDKIKQTLSSVALSGVMDLLMLVVSGPVLCNINGTLFGLSLCTVFIVSVISFIFARIYKNYYAKVMSENADVQSYLFESLNGVATVKSFNAEEFVNSEYEKKKMKAVSSSWKVNKFGISQGFLSGVINGISGLLIYWIGCTYIIKGNMSLGTLITFISLLGYFTGPLFRLVNIQNTVQESLVAAQRVGEILELESEQETDKKFIRPQTIKGHIQIKNITFRYGSRLPVYENFSLEIMPHSWVALVGSSGCGKSTLVKLLLKFYEVEKGRIFIDDNDIRDIDSKELRSKIGYVPQDIFLFSGTIRENICLHKTDASMDEIIEAAKRSGAHDFIDKLPKRYETVLGERGGGLSGGEKQRLALARALLGNPEILILDEATSNLDSFSENEIHHTLKQLHKENITVILIAHRLSTIKNCDKIFVMQEGKIIEEGTHFSLLKKNGSYKKMWGEIQ